MIHDKAAEKHGCQRCFAMHETVRSRKAPRPGPRSRSMANQRSIPAASALPGAGKPILFQVRQLSGAKCPFGMDSAKRTVGCFHGS
eukprot:3941306-Rhodomonas_salina.2